MTNTVIATHTIIVLYNSMKIRLIFIQLNYFENDKIFIISAMSSCFY